jgi:hypothetical protein
MTMRTYRGSCHCGKVRFEIQADLHKVVECNCSVCTRKGALHHRVPPDSFKLLSGEDALTPYQFGTKVAQHYFCKYCGIHPFSRPRAAPEMYSVNVRCLEDFHSILPDVEVVKFDGRNWEEAIKTLKLK